MPRRDNDEYKGDPELLRGVTSFDYKDAEFLKKFMTDWAFEGGYFKTCPGEG